MVGSNDEKFTILVPLGVLRVESLKREQQGRRISGKKGTPKEVVEEEEKRVYSGRATSRLKRLTGPIFTEGMTVVTGREG